MLFRSAAAAAAAAVTVLMLMMSCALHLHPPCTNFATRARKEVPSVGCVEKEAFVAILSPFPSSTPLQIVAMLWTIVCGLACMKCWPYWTSGLSTPCVTKCVSNIIFRSTCGGGERVDVRLYRIIIDNRIVCFSTAMVLELELWVRV